jgi:hypothetical protein
VSERQKSANTTRSKVRARVEHVFGQQQNSMGGKIVRTISIVRARFKCGMMNLGYNIRRLVQLERMAAVTSKHLNIGLLDPTTLKFVVRNKIWFSEHLTESPWFGRRRSIGTLQGTVAKHQLLRGRDGRPSALQSQIPYQIPCHSCPTDGRVSFYRR